ncbi:collagen alpha-1(I) chain-like [Pithys albifrons albifrons]|uniref:collagen alpha-1(I) chain-like n=1 Tax=Pithys albifrons albifrons TaxID=3385563 RepID=UPI003A5D10C5
MVAGRRARGAGAGGPGARGGRRSRRCGRRSGPSAAAAAARPSPAQPSPAQAALPPGAGGGGARPAPPPGRGERVGAGRGPERAAQRRCPVPLPRVPCPMSRAGDAAGRGCRCRDAAGPAGRRGGAVRERPGTATDHLCLSWFQNGCWHETTCQEHGKPVLLVTPNPTFCRQPAPSWARSLRRGFLSLAEECGCFSRFPGQTRSQKLNCLTSRAKAELASPASASPSASSLAHSAAQQMLWESLPGETVPAHLLGIRRCQLGWLERPISFPVL